MNSNSGMCNVPSVYLETVGLPQWRIRDWLRRCELHPHDREEIMGAVNDCLRVDGPGSKPVIVVSCSEEGRWDVYTKTEFYEVCDVD